MQVIEQIKSNALLTEFIYEKLQWYPPFIKEK